MIRKVLQPIWLETHHTETVRKYRIRGFGASAKQHTFPRLVEGESADNAERQSVYDYFREKYNITVKYPHLPTVGKSIDRNVIFLGIFHRLELFSPPNKTQFQYLPMECCTIQPWQRSMKPLTTDQRARVTRKTVVNPTDRYDRIMDIVKQRNFKDDRFLQEIGMTIDDEQMITVSARCIASPEIKYISGRDGQSEIVERINIGK